MRWLLLLWEPQKHFIQKSLRFFIESTNVVIECCSMITAWKSLIWIKYFPSFKTRWQFKKKKEYKFKIRQKTGYSNLFIHISCDNLPIIGANKFQTSWDPISLVAWRKTARTWCFLPAKKITTVRKTTNEINTIFLEQQLFIIIYVIYF